MYDPQQLTFAGKVRALIALGRIPLASETPLWSVLGCVIAWKTFPAVDISTPAKLWACLQCVLVTYCTNCSINYSNDYYDWALDRPGMVAAIKRDIKARGMSIEAEKGTDRGVQLGEEAAPTSTPGHQESVEKIFSSSSRVLHDGTFSPWVAIAISAAIQAIPLTLIAYSRHIDPTLNPSSTSSQHTPFRGLTLWVGLLSMIVSHEYIGPPLHLHYRGYGEVSSTILLSITSALFGMMGYFTSTHPLRQILLSDLLHPPTHNSFGIDGTLWVMLGAIYCTAQARILVMHINDIDVDRRGGKNTAVVRMGYEWAARLYVGLNIAGVSLWVWLIGRLVQGKGAMLGGMMAGAESSARVGKGWAIAVGIVLAYSVPVMALTAASLFANLPNRPKTPTTPPSIIPHKELAKVVSLQMLVTPVILSIAIVLA